MIYVDMKGNLGNQMFIYACSRSLQEKTKQTINISTYYLKKNNPNYKFSLDIFKLNENVIITNDKIPFYASSDSKFFKIFKKLTFNRKFFQNLYFKFFSLFNIFVYNGTTYKPLKLRKKTKNIYISGFFQSVDYFKDIEDIIKKEFETKNALSFKNENFLKEIQSTNSICLSIRRGDYVENAKIAKFHLVCDINYFFDALKVIKDKVENIQIVCFSDDPKWVKENMKFNDLTLYESEGNSLEDKIILMKECKHFILSNSSFSFWIEFLSNNKNKIVVSPKRWYANNQEADIFRSYRIKIPTFLDKEKEK